MITEKAFIVSIWLFFCFAACSSICRLLVQKAVFAKPYDNVISHGGLLIFLTSTVVMTLLVRGFVHLAFSPDDIAQSQLNNTFIKLQLATTVLITTCLWLVKIATLVSFFPLLDDFRLLRRAWYASLTAVAVSWAMCIIGYPFTACDSGKSSRIRNFESR